MSTYSVIQHDGNYIGTYNLVFKTGFVSDSIK